MKNIALAAMLGLALCGSAQAGRAENVPERGMVNLAERPAPSQPGGIAVLQSASSDLAEPEMFAMMLVGLCLIGYRVSRDSHEKFR